MNGRQAAALAAPLRNPGRDATRPYRATEGPFREPGRAAWVTTLLTVEWYPPDPGPRTFDLLDQVPGREVHPWWHACVALIDLDGHSTVNNPTAARERCLVLLEGVGASGGARWLWTPDRLGHLRVPLTAVEALLVPPAGRVINPGELGDEVPR